MDDIHVVLIGSDAVSPRLFEYMDGVVLVLTIDDMEHVLDSLADIRFEVILLGIAASVDDAVSLISDLINAYPRVQIIVLSKDDDPTTLKAVFRAGAVDFIGQPISPQDLETAIGRAFEAIPGELASPSPPMSAGYAGDANWSTSKKSYVEDSLAPGSEQSEIIGMETAVEDSEPRRGALFGKRGASGSEIDKDDLKTEAVQFTAYHPKDIKPETWYSLLFYLHLESALDRVKADADKFADEMADDARQVRSKTAAQLTRGAELCIVPSADGLEFNPTEVTLAWHEDVERANFRFKTTEDKVGEPVLGEVQVYVGALEVSSLRFSVFVSDDAAVDLETTAIPQSASSRVYQRIFASYSHDDTEVVRRAVEALKMVGFDILVDYESLKPGRDWSRQLEEMIEQADIFQLFWSENSAHSEAVRKEWEYALSLSKGTGDSPGEGFIRPVYWNQPLPDVPQPLSHLHFYLIPTAS